MITDNLIARFSFVLLCSTPYSFSESSETPPPFVAQEDIKFPLKKEWLEKRYAKRDTNTKIKLFFIIHNLGLNAVTTKKIIGILPENISISLSPYIKQNKDILTLIKQKDFNILWIQPMELYRQQSDTLDPYRLSRHKDQQNNMESIKNCFSDMHSATTGIIAGETSPVLRDEETLSTLFLELKKRKLSLLSPEMSVNSEFMDLCSKHGVKCDEADYSISRTDAAKDVISLLNLVRELGEQTGYAICVIDAHMPNIVILLDWCKKLDKDQFELSTYHAK